MLKKVFMIHGWEGYPENCWFPWLKKELEKRMFKVKVPLMPDTKHPKIENWVPFLAKLTKKADKDTYFVGHSIGCQTILRYLEATDVKIGGVILVAPWMQLNKNTIKEEGEKVIKLAKLWMETPINWKKIKQNCDNFICIFSDNDPYVPLINKELFENTINAKTITEHNKGHFDDSAGIKEFPIVLNELLKMSEE